MQRLWIANIAPGTSDEDLKALVAKYMHEVECGEIQRVEGDGSRPAAILSFSVAPFGAMATLEQRLNGLYWNGRKLICSAIAR